MRKLLKEISVIPGVNGSCIFDKKSGPLCKDLGPGLSADLLNTVGIHCIRLIQMGKMAGLAISSSHFRFDRYNVIGMPLESGAVLLTICDAQANSSLVETTASMLAADMREELEHGDMDTSASSSDKTVSAQEADVSDAEMRPLYDALEQALAEEIGPVAGMVIGDCIERWKQAGAAVPYRLNELAGMLEDEIGDEAGIKAFREKVQSLF